MAISVEAKREYDQRRYYERVRPSIFADKRCPTCDILLVSRFGAKRTRTYCRDCVERGHARKHQNQVHYQKYRDRILARLSQRKNETTR